MVSSPPFSKHSFLLQYCISPCNKLIHNISPTSEDKSETAASQKVKQELTPNAQNHLPTEEPSTIKLRTRVCV